MLEPWTRALQCDMMTVYNVTKIEWELHLVQLKICESEGQEKDSGCKYPTLKILNEFLALVRLSQALICAITRS